MRQGSPSAKRRFMPPRSTSAIPISFRRLTEPWSRAMSRLGQTVAADFDAPPLFLIAADLTVIHVDANVGEKDIGEVKPGDKASFTVEAYPNRRLPER